MPTAAPLLAQTADFYALPNVPTGYYAGWGTLALLIAGIAQGKNRSGLAWFLLALFFGPLALLILLLLDRLPQRR